MASFYSPPKKNAFPARSTLQVSQARLRSGSPRHRIARRDIDALAYPWVVTPSKFLHMNLNHMTRVPPLHGPSMALTGLRVIAT